MADVVGDRSGASSSDPLKQRDGRLSTLGYLALGVVCVAVFLTALDQTVVVTALVSMIGDIGVPITQPDRAAWIVSGYLLGYVIAMPLMGRISDVFGRRRVFALCLSIFAFGSLICALSPQLGAPVAPDSTTIGGAILTPFYNLVQALVGPVGQLGIDTSAPGLDILVAARFIQAVGGGALVPVAMAVAGDLFGGTRRGLALGLIGAVTEAGGVLGPVWGAWVTTALGWTWIFWLNLPLAALLLLVGAFCLPKARGRREPVDILGALIFGGSLTFLTLGLGQQTEGTGVLSPSAHSTFNPAFLGIAAGLFVLFVVMEFAVHWPVVDPRLFRRVAFGAAALLSLIIGVALIVALVEIPLFLASLQNTTPIAAGLALLRMTALVPVGAFVGGWLSGRIGCPWTAALGTLLTAAGLWQMSLWPANVGDIQVTVATVTAGLGFGLVIAPISTSALNASPAAQAGVASSVVTALRMTGMILGLSGLTAWGLEHLRAILASQPKLGTPGGPTASQYLQIVTTALHQVYSDIFLVTALLALIGVIPALLLWRRSKGTTDDAQIYESYVAPLG
ncbi:MAG TPA: MFS transporter [Ktedonobacterales bacterium]|nr:MFS transporter [Ktedonobacterales bacterium]